MDDNKIIDDYNDKSEGQEFDSEMAVETKSGEVIASESRVMPMNMAASMAVAHGDISDVKEYPESPFSYYETNQVNIQLCSGDLQYEVTDFVLPGRDGFDVSIARRYNSGCANLVDMNPVIYINNKIVTGKKDNSHNTKSYGLGYGWSFVLPSIETVPYLNMDDQLSDGYDVIYALSYYDYILHLEDGRNLNISRRYDKFHDYPLKDVSITSQKGTIHHPYATGVSKNHNIVIEYKNGNKDYFEETNYGRSKRNDEYKLNFKLVAREDRFGNRIFYDLKDNGGMTIIDTWGREIRLEKTDNGLTWKLPGGEAEVKYEISYQSDKKAPLKLTSVTDQVGCVTRYAYQTLYECDMRYASREETGLRVISSNRPYQLLEKITYPDNAFTRFEYKKGIPITNEAGGQIDHYQISTKEDCVGNDQYHRTEYSYGKGDAPNYKDDIGSEKKVIKAHSHTIVTKHQYIEETYWFNKEGLLTQKEIRHHGVPVLNSEYKYEKKLMVSAVDLAFNRNDTSKKLEKKMFWEYSTDNKANILVESEEYPEDHECDQEIIMKYGNYSIVTEITRKKGSDVILEKIELFSELDYRVVKSKEISENGVLKEKTDYGYGDSNNQYCITSEKRYALDGASNFIQTVYTYNSGKHTHKFVSKEQKGINGAEIKNADGNACGSIEETYRTIRRLPVNTGAMVCVIVVRCGN